MANPKHVEIVKRGREAIAEWLASHSRGRFDLSGADLRGADLSRADLRKVDLARAHLWSADLREANLSGAALLRADFFLADLRGADLSGALLALTNLTRANLKDADLGSARLGSAILGDTNLSGARGLDSVRHDGPSVIDETTLRRSWPLPEKFLRGCGLSDRLIEYLPSLLGEAIEFYSCFISYSSNDDEFAKRLHADLQDNGVRCWFAPEDLKIGERIRPGIDEAIRLHDKLLLILSEHSVSSQWVEQEVETALERERKQKRTSLFPIRLDDAVMESMGGWAALIRNTRNIGDFTRWKEHDEYQEAFERLLRDLKAESATDRGTD